MQMVLSFFSIYIVYLRVLYWVFSLRVANGLYQGTVFRCTLSK